MDKKKKISNEIKKKNFAIQIQNEIELWRERKIHFLLDGHHLV